MLPTKPFRSSFEHEVRSLTLLASRKGSLSLVDVEGHILANYTHNTTTVEDGMTEYAPIKIIGPSHVNDNMFSILSPGRLDTFRIRYEGETAKKSVLIIHEWSKDLKSEGVEGKVLVGASSR